MQQSALPAFAGPILAPEVLNEVRRIVEDLTADYIYHLSRIIPACIKAHNIVSNDPSQKILKELCENCARDIVKLSIYQRDLVDPIKTFGYLCFWVRKLKPISNATQGGSLIEDVNERLSIWLMEWIVEEYYETFSNDDEKRQALEIRRRLRSLVSSEKRMEYIIYCMRSRTFGPHHYVIFLDLIVKS